jgi:hypothetical protein
MVATRLKNLITPPNEPDANQATERRSDYRW